MKPTKQMIAAWQRAATAEHKFSPAAAERHAFALAFAAGERAGLTQAAELIDRAATLSAACPSDIQPELSGYLSDCAAAIRAAIEK